MGVNQSIPPHRIEPPRFRIGPPGKPMPRGNQYCRVRSLFWRLAPTGVTVRLETDVALCFGDVYRVLLLLHHDDAELDNGRPDQRHLLPARHQRPQFVDGVPADDGHRHDAGDDADDEDDDDEDKDDEPQPYRWHHPTQVICAAGNWMPFTRQIAHNSTLQKDSTVNMIMSGPRRTAWRALPRQHTAGGQRGSWALPSGWDDGLCDVVANHDALQLTGRSAFILQHLTKIVEHDGMRLVSFQYDREDGKDAKPMVEQLMARVTDNIDDAPLDFFVAIRPPVDAAIYHNRSSGGGLASSIEFVVHVQLPPTYPLAGERYRMLTPILHPFVAPLWPGNVDVGVYGGRDDDKCRAWLEGGRMAFASGSKEQARPNPFSTNDEGFAEMLTWFRDESLLDPVGCASRFLEKSPDDATTEVKRWASPGGGEEMASRASRLAQDGGVVRWRPELHRACPRAFRAEVRALLLVRLRAQATSSVPVDGGASDSSPMAEMPEEVVHHIIDALLGLHLSAGSSFLYFSA